MSELGVLSTSLLEKAAFCLHYGSTTAAAQNILQVSERLGTAKQHADETAGANPSLPLLL